MGGGVRARAGAGREAKVVGRGEAEHAAEGAQDAAGLGGGGDEGAGFGGGEESLHLAGVLGGALGEQNQAEAAGGDVGALGAGRLGGRDSRGGTRAGHAQDAGLDVAGDGVEAVDHAGEAAVDQDQQRGKQGHARGPIGHDGAEAGDDQGEGLGQGVGGGDVHLLVI